MPRALLGLELGRALRQLNNGDWMTEVTMVETGEKAEYRWTQTQSDACQHFRCVRAREVDSKALRSSPAGSFLFNHWLTVERPTPSSLAISARVAPRYAMSIAS